MSGKTESNKLLTGMGETEFKERLVLPFLKNLPNTWYEKIQQVAIRGTPDILACINGYFVAIEMKRSGKTKPDKLQAFKLDKIAKAGGAAILANPENWSEVAERLTGLSEIHIPKDEKLRLL